MTRADDLRRRIYLVRDTNPPLARRLTELLIAEVRASLTLADPAVCRHVSCYAPANGRSVTRHRAPEWGIAAQLCPAHLAELTGRLRHRRAA